MDGKREEVLPFLDRLGSGDRAQDHRLAERRDDRAVGLAGNLARFESQRFTAPLDRYFFHVKHGVSRSEENTSELQALMRISYAVFCLKKKSKITIHKIKITKANKRA